MATVATASTELSRRAAAVFLFSEHLEAALAHGEALVGLCVTADTGLVSGATVPALLRQNRNLDRVVADARRLELALTLRLTQARRCAVEVRRQDPYLKPLLQLFEAGTRTLDDIAADPKRDAAMAFATGGAARAYASSRGLLPEAGLGTPASGAEAVLLFGSLQLATLLDLVAATLDSLDSVQDAGVAAVE